MFCFFANVSIFLISMTVSELVPVCFLSSDRSSVFFSFSVVIGALFSVLFVISSSLLIVFKLLEISSKDGNSDAKARRIRIISATICGIS